MSEIFNPNVAIKLSELNTLINERRLQHERIAELEAVAERNVALEAKCALLQAPLHQENDRNAALEAQLSAAEEIAKREIRDAMDAKADLQRASQYGIASKHALDIDKLTDIAIGVYDNAHANRHDLVCGPCLGSAIEAVAREFAPPLPAIDREALHEIISDGMHDGNSPGAIADAVIAKLAEAQAPVKDSLTTPYDAEAELKSVRRERDEYRARFEALEREQTDLQANAYDAGHEQGQATIAPVHLAETVVTDENKLAARETNRCNEGADRIIAQFAARKNRELRTVRPATREDVRAAFADGITYAKAAETLNARLGFTEGAK